MTQSEHRNIRLLDLGAQPALLGAQRSAAKLVVPTVSAVLQQTTYKLLSPFAQRLSSPGQEISSSGILWNIRCRMQLISTSLDLCCHDSSQGTAEQAPTSSSSPAARAEVTAVSVPLCPSVKKGPCECGRCCDSPSDVSCSTRAPEAKTSHTSV